MFPAGLGSQISTWVCKSTTRPTVNQVILPRISRECSMWNTPTPSFCMWNSQNWIEYPGPLFKNTLILKRCLYYNHLPQPISAAHRKRKILQKKPLRNPFFWSSESNQTQDPNADDYDKYSPLAEEWGDCNDQDKIDAAEAEAAVAEKKIVKSFVSLVRPALLACWESWVVQTHCYQSKTTV